MRKATPLIAAVLALALPATAVAHRHRRHPHPAVDPVALALKLGEQYWAVPMPCQPVVRFTEELPSATEALPAGAHGAMIGAWVMTGTCTINFNARIGWAYHAVQEADFHLFCDLMAHELGHLLGHEDGEQTDPNNIEWPVIGVRSANYNSVPECLRTRSQDDKGPLSRS